MSKPTARELLDNVKKWNDPVADSDELALAARVERVLVNHRAQMARSSLDGKLVGTGYCVGCYLPWPCPTRRYLDGEEP